MIKIIFRDLKIAFVRYNEIFLMKIVVFIIEVILKVDGVQVSFFYKNYYSF